MESYFIKRHFSRGLFWLLVALIAHLIPNIGCTCHNGELLVVGVNEVDRLNILQTHNSLRSCIAIGKDFGECKTIDYNQPNGKNIQELAWDESLAATAQDWANRCLFAHDTNEHRFDSRFCVGQNVHITKLTFHNDSFPNADFPHAIRKWFHEHNDYKYSVHVGGGKKKTNHYTQLVWATSNLVGCGYVYYHDKHDNQYPYKKLYVCNYGPCGNEIKQFPYDYGQPACNEYNFLWSTYDGLCINSQISPASIVGLEDKIKETANGHQESTATNQVLIVTEPAISTLPLFSHVPAAYLQPVIQSTEPPYHNNQSTNNIYSEPPIPANYQQASKINSLEEQPKPTTAPLSFETAASFTDQFLTQPTAH